MSKTYTLVLTHSELAYLEGCINVADEDGDYATEEYEIDGSALLKNIKDLLDSK